MCFSSPSPAVLHLHFAISSHMQFYIWSVYKLNKNVSNVCYIPILDVFPARNR
jgi:hypothetical protein